MIRDLSRGVVYIGADDLDLDLFESQYAVPEGMAYNSYLIRDSRTAILDTVDPRKADEWMGNLLEALGEACPDYLVVHHLEPDHTGMIAAVLEKWPALTLVASAKAIAMNL